MLETPFALKLKANIIERVKILKRGGTVAMGIDNLYQVTPTPSRGLVGEPGSPAAYRVLFSEVCDSSKLIQNFLLKS